MSCDFVDVSLFEPSEADLIQPNGVELGDHLTLVIENGLKLDIHHLHDLHLLLLQLCRWFFLRRSENLHQPSGKHQSSSNDLRSRWGWSHHG
jgi:hypothetical protein